MRRSRLVGGALLLAALVSLVGCVSAGRLPGTAAAEADRWKVPEVPPFPVSELPRLSQPLALDGELKEWTGAVYVPIRMAARVGRTGPHEWQGPADAGLEVYCAWTDAGLAIAAVASDDDVRTQAGDENLWRDDALKIYFDLRAPDRVLEDPRSPGFQMFYARPPGDATVQPLHTVFAGGTLKELKVVGKRTADGYVAEMLVPWSDFPTFAPKLGSKLALEFALNDLDTRDGAESRAQVVSSRGSSGAVPGRMLPFALAQVVTNPAAQALHFGAALRMPGHLGDVAAIPLELGFDRSFPEVSRLRVRICDAVGREVATQEVAAACAQAPGGRSCSPRVLRPDGLSVGCYLIGVEFIATDGQSLGSLSGLAAYSGDTLPAALAALRRADIARLSQTEPFRAAAWLAVGAAAERLKRSIELADAVQILPAIREVNARVRLLRDGRLAAEDSGVYRLLPLAADPEAQVVIEFFRSSAASVAFHCGGVPFAAATVSDLGDHQKALEALEGSQAMLRNLGTAVTFAGLPARVHERTYRYRLVTMTDVNPTRQVVVVSSQRLICCALDLRDLSCANVTTAAILADCPAATRQAVETWARQNGAALTGFADAFGRGEPLLVAGNPQSPEAAEKLKALQWEAVEITDQFGGISMVKDSWLVRIDSSTRSVAERMARLIAAGKPVSTGQADRIRRDLVAAHKSAKPQFPPAGSRLFCGDVHMHTIHSDGSPTPAGLLLEAVHGYLDFAVVTDHNTLEGALVARKLFDDHRLSYPIIVGEEITTSWSHLNAYPLQRLIAWTQPLEALVKDAHDQGAVIQWNHPGYPDSEWSKGQIGKRLEGTGLDAWEHIPEDYDAWKRAGQCPVLTGSTDTHDGTFGSGERSVILAATLDGADLAGAIRAGRVALLDPRGAEVVYGPDNMTAMVWSALAEGKALRAAKAGQLRWALRRADIAALIEVSPPRPVPVAELGAKPPR